MKVAFIGLGAMGKGMALNMLKNGADMIVCDLRDKDFPEFTKHGAKATTNHSETAQADIIFLCLPDSAVVKSVIYSESLFPLLREGQILVDFSTIKYTVTQDIYKRLAEKGVYFIDAPISGMPFRANDGTLTVMCGGDEKIFEKVKPYLDFVGSNIIYMGQSGNGQLTKLTNNLLYNINIAAVAEILPMAVKLGLDCEKISAVINTGTGRSFASEYFVPRILERNFSDAYPMKLAYKDMVGAAEIAANNSIPTPVLAAANSTYQMAMLNGHGDCSKGGMIQVFEKLLNVTCQKKG